MIKSDSHTIPVMRGQDTTQDSLTHINQELYAGQKTPLHLSPPRQMLSCPRLVFMPGMHKWLEKFPRWTDKDVSIK